MNSSDPRVNPRNIVLINRTLLHILHGLFLDYLVTQLFKPSKLGDSYGDLMLVTDGIANPLL